MSCVYGQRYGWSSLLSGMAASWGASGQGFRIWPGHREREGTARPLCFLVRRLTAAVTHQHPHPEDVWTRLSWATLPSLRVYGINLAWLLKMTAPRSAGHYFPPPFLHRWVGVWSRKTQYRPLTWTALWYSLLKIHPDENTVHAFSQGCTS